MSASPVADPSSSSHATNNSTSLAQLLSHYYLPPQLRFEDHGTHDATQTSVSSLLFVQNMSQISSDEDFLATKVQPLLLRYQQHLSPLHIDRLQTKLDFASEDQTTSAEQRQNGEAGLSGFLSSFFRELNRLIATLTESSPINPSTDRPHPYGRIVRIYWRIGESGATAKPDWELAVEFASGITIVIGVFELKPPRHGQYGVHDGDINNIPSQIEARLIDNPLELSRNGLMIPFRLLQQVRLKDVKLSRKNS